MMIYYEGYAKRFTQQPGQAAYIFTEQIQCMFPSNTFQIVCYRRWRVLGTYFDKNIIFRLKITLISFQNIFYLS